MDKIQYLLNKAARWKEILKLANQLSRPSEPAPSQKEEKKTDSPRA